MRRALVVFAALAAAVLLIGGAVKGAESLRSGACEPPAAILASSQQDAVAAVEKWVEQEVAPNWDVKYGGLVDAEIVLTAQAEAKAYKQGLDPASLDLEVNVVYDALKDPFFGGIVSAEKWKKYAVTVSRDCADGDWHVSRFKLLNEGGQKGKDSPLPGSVGVPDNS